LLQHEYESAHVEDKRLASVRLLEEKDRMVAGLQAEIEKLRVEKDNMYKQLIQIATVKEDPTNLLSAAVAPSVWIKEVKDKPMKLLTSVEAVATCQDSLNRSASSSKQSSEEQEGDGSHEESQTRWYRNSN